MGKKVHDTELSIDELRKRAVKAKALAAEIRALFPEARTMSKDDRRRSQGKLGEGETKALRGVVDAIELEPAMFTSLADEDEGHDPTRVETELLRDRFDRVDVYNDLRESMEAVTAVFSDAALSVGAKAKPVTLAAYEIAKPISKRHEGIREKIAPALDYYGGNAAAGAATRRANKEAAKASAK